MNCERCGCRVQCKACGLYAAHRWHTFASRVGLAMLWFGLVTSIVRAFDIVPVVTASEAAVVWLYFFGGTVLAEGLLFYVRRRREQRRAR